VSEDPRDALLDVARQIIAKRGYVGLTMRTASAAAGVTEDVALRYYRNREALFAAAMRLPVDPVSAIPALMAPGIEGMGERLVRFTLDTLRDPEARDDLMSLARTGVSAGQAVTGLQDFIETGVVDRVAGMIGVPDARMRSALITSYLMGVATMRYGVRLEPLASASDEEVIRMVAPVIQDLLDPRRPIPGSARARSRSAASQPDSPTAPTSGPRTRTFDPDPASTRRAEAASRPGAPATSGADRSGSERAAPSGRTRARTVTTPAAATASTPARQPTGSGAPTHPPATGESGTTAPTRPAATKAPATTSPTTTTPATRAPATKPRAKKTATTKSPASTPATTKSPARKPASRKPPAKRSPSTTTAASSASGPKHAKDGPDPTPS
jgi:AcrR family transcriptional regulator